MMAASKWWQSPNGGKINILNEKNIFTGDVRFCVCVMNRQNHYCQFKHKIFLFTGKYGLFSNKNCCVETDNDFTCS